MKNSNCIFFNITYDVLYHFVEFEIKSQLILGEKYLIFLRTNLTNWNSLGSK